MGISILTFVTTLVLAVIVLRRSPDQAVRKDRHARWLLSAAFVLMGLNILFWLYFGIGEMARGDMSGAIHLAPAILLAVLMTLVWRRPVEGGTALLILGVAASLYYGAATMQGGGAFQPLSLIGGMPFLVIGLILLAAAALARRRKI